ncbi:MAG: hypothetical protein ACKOFW_00990, partial [Planctomycetaceae bacterium]
AQLAELEHAIQALGIREGGAFEQVLVSGSGSFLGRKVSRYLPATQFARKLDLDQLVSPEVAAAAPACAVAVLCSEQGCHTKQATGEEALNS